MSTVNQDGKRERPSWLYKKGNADVKGWECMHLEMAESIRNTVEQVRDSQMMQCDVAHAIKGILRELKGLRRDLKAHWKGKP